MSNDTTAVLESGLYNINVLETGSFVFRYSIEDHSLNPKPVYALHPGVQPVGPWELKKQGDGKYILKAINGPTGVYKDHVYAFLIEGQEGPVEWEITKAISTDQKKGWIIETILDRGERVGWSTYGQAEQFGTKVAVRPLPSSRSLPPQYFVSDVFEFTRVLDN